MCDQDLTFKYYVKKQRRHPVCSLSIIQIKNIICFCICIYF